MTRKVQQDEKIELSIAGFGDGKYYSVVDYTRSWVLGGLPYPSVHFVVSYCKVIERNPPNAVFVYTKVNILNPNIYWTMTSSSG